MKDALACHLQASIGVAQLTPLIVHIFASCDVTAQHVSVERVRHWALQDDGIVDPPVQRPDGVVLSRKGGRRRQLLGKGSASHSAARDAFCVR